MTDWSVIVNLNPKTDFHMGVTGVSEAPIALPSLANFARRQRFLICRVCGVFGALRPFHVIACEAKQSILSSCDAMYCFASLAMTVKYRSHVARMERSAIRDSLTASTPPPDFAALHPGYEVPRSAVIEIHVRIPATHRARALQSPFPLTKEGAGNAGCLLHPRSRVQCVKESAHEHTGTAGALRHSLRNGLTAYAALSLETNSSCLHRCRLDG